LVYVPGPLFCYLPAPSPPSCSMTLCAAAL
jgi:hypothetical protein